VHDVQLGRSIRALRRRRDWRQADLAAAAGVSRSLISLIERGQIDDVRISRLRGIARALEGPSPSTCDGAGPRWIGWSMPVTRR
jgi:transcriptional regulator with XRE-family HTH domain